MAPYKAVRRSALEYSSSIWSPLESSPSINKLQVMQNAALRTAPHNAHKTQTYMTKHSYFPYTSSYSSTRTIQTKTQHPSHPLHKHTTYFNTPRLKKLSFTTAATQQTFPQTPTHSPQQT